MKAFELKFIPDSNAFEFTLYDREELIHNSIYKNEQVVFKALCRAEHVQTTMKDKYNPNPIPNKVVKGSVEILTEK
ncbi:MAG TPA: hypothetical protein DHV48_03690 [Prolixibacteraceae bacterium]|nr:hypothetical protein [Prolixibacteraceae bacterium]